MRLDSHNSDEFRVIARNPLQSVAGARSRSSAISPITSAHGRRHVRMLLNVRRMMVPWPR